MQDNANFYAASAYSSYDYGAAAAVGANGVASAAQGFGDAWNVHAPHSGSPGTGLGGVGTLPQYSNITCLTAVGNNAMNGSQTPPMAHAALGMSAAPLPAGHPGSASSPGAVLQSDYAPAASLVAAGYSYATSGSGLDNGKCASPSVSAWVFVSISDKQWQGRGVGRRGYCAGICSSDYRRTATTHGTRDRLERPLSEAFYCSRRCRWRWRRRQRRGTV